MIDTNRIIAVAQEAGELILQVYRRDFAVHDKADASPLTEADMQAHRHIMSALQEHAPHIPVLSEEGDAAAADHRMEWTRYWLVDPLDGTKEFINKRDEFTVNIALVEDGVPVFGVVHAPALGLTYWGDRERGAFKVRAGAAPEPIRVAPPAADRRWRVVGSRLHGSGEFDAFMQRLPGADLIAMGSSLKLCLVAEGAADLYPRLGPTSEWDTAAAQAVVEAAGGQVLSFPALSPLRYNRRVDTLLNPHFIVCAAVHEQWAPAGLTYEHRDNDSKADVVWHHTQVGRAMRARSLGQRPCCIWLTGLSGSGKSTIANALELALHEAGRHTFLLDGDNVRHGLNKDLGMDEAARAENIRRVGEVARLMVDAGLIVVTAFISPFRRDRESARALFGPGEFLEVFVDTPLAECERRDPKGLYKKAREGRLKDFTGIDSPYEPPANPEIVIQTHRHDIGHCVRQILGILAATPRV